MTEDNSASAPLSLQLPNSGFNLRFQMHDSAIKKHGGRHGFRPHRVRRIHGNKIPENTVTVTALGLRLRTTGVLRELLRNQVLRIPDLFNAGVGDPPQDATAGLPPIRREDRLPHCKDLYLGAWIPAQNTLDCGGPPQTCRSSWREERDDADAPSGFIEFIL